MTRILSVFLATAVSLAAAGDPAILEIRVLEGEGASYFTGSRATRGITVMVTDETGRPVEGATVSFSLPPDGPSGAFISGSRTEIATTRSDGRAAAWGMQWNQSPGPFEIRITAVKGPARAGTTAAQYLSSGSPGKARSSSRAVPAANSTGTPQPSVNQESPRGVRTGGHKWIWVTLAVTGAAVAGASFAGRSSNGTSTSATPSTLQIGMPTITLGRP